MEGHLVGREFSYDYLVLVPLVAVLFNLFLASTKKWKELALFNIAGGINLAMEFALISSGKRTFSHDGGLVWVSMLLSLGWVTNGFVCSLMYINLRQWLKGLYPVWFVAVANVVYFAALPLAMMDWGLFEGAASTAREMNEAIVYIEPAAVAVLSAVIYFIGYRGLLWRMLLIGALLDLGFEGSLFISGVRPAGSFDLVHVGGRVLFEMNTMFCLGFLVFKGLFGLRDYRDESLRSG